LCLGGVVCGIGLSYLVRMICLRVFPSLTILITPKWMLLSMMIAIVGGLLGAAYPAWLASRKDPVEALAYE
jgi:putative ABC transport system permease protein